MLQEQLKERIGEPDAAAPALGFDVGIHHAATASWAVPGVSGAVRRAWSWACPCVSAAWLAAWMVRWCSAAAGVRIVAAVLVGLPLALFADAEHFCGAVEPGPAADLVAPFDLVTTGPDSHYVVYKAEAAHPATGQFIDWLKSSLG